MVFYKFASSQSQIYLSVFKQFRISCICILCDILYSARDFLRLSLYEHMLLFTNLTLYVYTRLISIHPFRHDDDNLQIPGYNLFREDHPLNVKRGAFIHDNISFPLKIKNIHYLQECIKNKDKQCNFITLYHWPNHAQYDFESFINNFDW